MRVTILACVVMTAGAAQAAGPTEPVQVTLWERVWTVAPIKERPGSYSAIRDAGDNNPFGRPAIRKSVQAKRAIETATGCKVTWSTMTKDIRDTFYAPVTCP